MRSAWRPAADRFGAGRTRSSRRFWGRAGGADTIIAVVLDGFVSTAAAAPLRRPTRRAFAQTLAVMSRPKRGIASCSTSLGCRPCSILGCDRAKAPARPWQYWCCVQRRCQWDGDLRRSQSRRALLSSTLVPPPVARMSAAICGPHRAGPAVSSADPATYQMNKYRRSRCRRGIDDLIIAGWPRCGRQARLLLFARSSRG